MTFTSSFVINKSYIIRQFTRGLRSDENKTRIEDFLGISDAQGARCYRIRIQLSGIEVHIGEHRKEVAGGG
jgi:hypothetical protein